MRHDSFICKTWLVLYVTCFSHSHATGCYLASADKDKTYLNFRHASLICETMVHLYVGQESFICDTWLIHIICETWLVHMWHDSSTCNRALSRIGQQRQNRYYLVYAVKTNRHTPPQGPHRYCNAHIYFPHIYCLSIYIWLMYVSCHHLVWGGYD